jgi:hypothetical protein
MTGSIVFNTPADGTGLYIKHNNTDYNTIRNHNNGNISINACEGGIYLGYVNTNQIRLGASGNWGYINANGIYGAVWNDYAEFRN